jgi:aminoglycoside 6'-N-acetyltransferase
MGELRLSGSRVVLRAIAAYEKVGFKPVGVMRRHELGPGGVWRDALLLDMLEGELR